MLQRKFLLVVMNDTLSWDGRVQTILNEVFKDVIVNSQSHKLCLNLIRSRPNLNTVILLWASIIKFIL